MRDFAVYSMQGSEAPYDVGRTEKITAEEAIEYIKQTRLLKRMLEEEISKLPVLTREEYLGFGKIKPRKRVEPKTPYT
jgi:hypothetical protein